MAIHQHDVTLVRCRIHIKQQPATRLSVELIPQPSALLLLRQVSGSTARNMKLSLIATLVSGLLANAHCIFQVRVASLSGFSKPDFFSPSPPPPFFWNTNMTPKHDSSLAAAATRQTYTRHPERYTQLTPFPVS